jgi:dihydrofolate synthase/folylpolyglutamate synthase
MGFHPYTHAIVGMLADKDVDAVIGQIKDKVDHWHAVPTSGPRGLSAEALAQRLQAQGCDAPAFDWQATAAARRSGGIVRQAPDRSVQAWPDIAEAFRCLQDAVDANDRIVVFGSFLTVAAVMKARHKVK